MSRRGYRAKGDPIMERVPGFLMASLDRARGELVIEFVDPVDRTEEQIERGLAHRERCTTPSPALIERIARLNSRTGQPK